jgi:hypothetical protein
LLLTPSNNVIVIVNGSVDGRLKLNVPCAVPPGAIVPSEIGSGVDTVAEGLSVMPVIWAVAVPCPEFVAFTVQVSTPAVTDFDNTLSVSEGAPLVKFATMFFGPFRTKVSGFDVLGVSPVSVYEYVHRANV